MKFESYEVEESYNALYEKYGYFHINYGFNYVITMEDVYNANELLNKFKED